MKAKDYFTKYESSIINSDDKGFVDAVSKMMIELNSEVKDLISARHIRTDSGTIAVFKEMNQKWNAIVRLFETKYGWSPIIRDGYQLFWIREMPELRLLWKGEEK